jgi:hypothetical protein
MDTVTDDLAIRTAKAGSQQQSAIGVPVAVGRPFESSILQL